MHAPLQREFSASDNSSVHAHSKRCGRQRARAGRGTSTAFLTCFLLCAEKVREKKRRERAGTSDRGASSEATLKMSALPFFKDLMEGRVLGTNESS